MYGSTSAKRTYSKRLRDHYARKDFWNHAVLITSADDNITKAHARYLEARLIARQAITMLDDICFHGMGQDLQRRVAELLRLVGRDTEADQWQADADRYDDWDVFMEQEIPGHVHLWDIRIALSDRGKSQSDQSE